MSSLATLPILQACWPVMPEFVRLSFWTHCMVFNPPAPVPGAQGAAAANLAAVKHAREQLAAQYTPAAGSEDIDDEAVAATSGRKRVRGSGRSTLQFSLQYSLAGIMGLAPGNAIIPPDQDRALQIAQLSQEAEAGRVPAMQTHGSRPAQQQRQQQQQQGRGRSGMAAQPSAEGRSTATEEVALAPVAPINVVFRVARRLLTITATQQALVKLLWFPMMARNIGLTKEKGGKHAVSFAPHTGPYALPSYHACQVCPPPALNCRRKSLAFLSLTCPLALPPCIVCDAPRRLWGYVWGPCCSASIRIECLAPACAGEGGGVWGGAGWIRLHSCTC